MKNLFAFACMAIAVTMVSCSKNAPNEGPDPNPKGEVAYLSVTVGNAATKAVTSDAIEANLKTVDIWVFDEGNVDNTEKGGAAVDHQRLTAAGAVTSISTDDGTDKDFELTAGHYYTIVAVGNLPAAVSISATATISQIMNNTVILNQQTVNGSDEDGSFIMFKKAVTAALEKGYNSVGGNKTAYTSKLDDFKLERLVAKVQVTASKSGDATTKLTISKAYLLNANSGSFLGTKNTLPAPLEFFWNYNTASDNNSYIHGGMVGAGTIAQSYPRFAGYYASPKYSPADVTVTTIPAIYKDGYTGSQTSFYTFENHQNDANTPATMAVVEGTWEGTPVYYPVIINVAGSDYTYGVGQAATNKIEHNKIYNITLNISGKGSQNPWDEDTRAYMRVNVSVADWSEQIDQTVTW